ncbi:MAG: replication-associated recombination protein A [Bdellovibrionota bacterium]
MDLFDKSGGPGAEAPKRLQGTPLADRLRPQSLEEFVGQSHLTGAKGLIRTAVERKQVQSMVFWGPPGTGKTTLCRLLAKAAGLPFVPFSAVTGGVKEIREIAAEAEGRRRRGGPPTVLFVDEIHHFSKSQQDAFLPHVESGTIILLGATTENPSFELNSALLSRLRVVVLEPLSRQEVEGLLSRALQDPERGLGGQGLSAAPGAIEKIARQSFGDARSALNLLEGSAVLVREAGEKEITEEAVDRALQGAPIRYDKKGEQHYDIASAFIKSMRGSDPDAAVYWLARMLEGGEEPRFIARRMVIFASEDVGNADPRGLLVAAAVAQAVEFVGLPEARINLAHGATYLAMAPKSNASYSSLGAAQAAVREKGPLPVPLHLRNAPTGLMKELGYHKGYEYAHDSATGETAQQHLPDEIRGERFYEPKEIGEEKALKEKLQRLRDRRKVREDDKGVI